MYGASAYFINCKSNVPFDHPKNANLHAKEHLPLMLQTVLASLPQKQLHLQHASRNVTFPE